MKQLSLLAAVLMVAACAPSASVTADGRPALRSDDVVVYRSEGQVPGEYEVVEVIVPPSDIAREGSGYNATDAVERFARRRAAALGANGVLVVSTAEADSEARSRSAVLNGYTLTPGTFVAIRVTEAPADR